MNPSSDTKQELKRISSFIHGTEKVTQYVVNDEEGHTKGTIKIYAGTLRIETKEPRTYHDALLEPMVLTKEMVQELLHEMTVT